MYCIIVTGMPATGKTTIAKFLGKELNLPVFSKDAVKELMYDTVGFRSRAEKVKLGIASMNIMYYTAEQLMKCRQPFILENNFENISREGLAALLERYQYSVVTVALYGDDKKIYERFVKRNHSPERHRGHVVDDCYPEEKGDRMVRTASFEDFIAGMKSRGMDCFSVDGYRISVDTTDFRVVDLEELLREIIQWRDKIPVIK